MNRYTLKMECADEPGIYRCIEIDGDKKLSYLAKQIVNAFDFTDEHLYMFSLTRKMYDPGGYYAPGADEGRKAAETSLDELGLSVRKKILFLYDFGDDWCFTITVKKKAEADKKGKTLVTEGAGELEQYPDPEDWDEWDDEWDDDDMEEDAGELTGLADLQLEHCEEIERGLYLSDGYFSIQELREKGILDDSSLFEMPEEDELPKFYAVWKNDIFADGNVMNQRIWDTRIPAAMKWLVIQLAQKKITGEMLMEQTVYCNLLCMLELLAIEMDEVRQTVTIVVPRELKEIASFLKDGAWNVERDKELEDYVMSLLGFYSIIELSALADILRNGFGVDETQEYIFEHIIRPMQDTKLLYVVNNKEGRFISVFEEEFTKRILLKIRRRNKNAKYKKLSPKELAALKAGNFESIVTETSKLFQRLLDSAKYDMDFLEEFMDRFGALSRIGLRRTDFYEGLGDLYEQLGGEKGSYAKQIEKARLQYPTAAYMGYSMDEVGQIENGGYRQASLWDDDLPF